MELPNALEESTKDLGFDKLKQKQNEAIEAFVSGRSFRFFELDASNGRRHKQQLLIAGSLPSTLVSSIFDELRATCD